MPGGRGGRAQNATRQLDEDGYGSDDANDDDERIVMIIDMGDPRNCNGNAKNGLA